MKIVRQMSLSLMIGELIFISRDVLRTNATIHWTKLGVTRAYRIHNAER